MQRSGRKDYGHTELATLQDGQRNNMHGNPTLNRSQSQDHILYRPDDSPDFANKSGITQTQEFEVKVEDRGLSPASPDTAAAGRPSVEDSVFKGRTTTFGSFC